MLTTIVMRMAGLHIPAISVILLGIVGCGSGGPELGTVRGVVTLNGQPLPNAVVEFQPPQGSPSLGVTNAEGTFQLRYTRDKTGALIATHTVRITTFRRAEDEQGKVTVQSERVPERYNRKSTLSAEVKPGSNRIDFSLESAAAKPARRY